jgi:hypothetical protein
MLIADDRETIELLNHNISSQVEQSLEFMKGEAVPKLQFLEQLLTPGENRISHKCLSYKELAIFSKS